MSLLVYNLSGELTVILITLVVAKVRERLAVSKVAQKFDVQRFSLKKLSELEGRKHYEIKILTLSPFHLNH